MDFKDYPIWKILAPNINRNIINDVAAGDSYADKAEIEKNKLLIPELLESGIIPVPMDWDLGEALSLYGYRNYNINSSRDEIIGILFCSFILTTAAEHQEYDLGHYCTDIITGIDCSLILGKKWSKAYFDSLEKYTIFLERYYIKNDYNNYDLLYFYMGLLILAILQNKDSTIRNMYKNRVLKLYRQRKKYFDCVGSGNMRAVFAGCVHSQNWDSRFNETGVLFFLGQQNR